MEPVYIPSADEGSQKQSALPGAPSEAGQAENKPVANKMREFSRFVGVFMGSALAMSAVAPLCDAMEARGVGADWVAFCALSVGMLGAIGADKLRKKLGAEGKLPSFMYRGGKKYG